MNDITQQIAAQARALGFHAVGIASIDPNTNQTAATRLQEWLSLGYQAEMGWMSDPRRQDIYQVMPAAKTVIAVALNYYTDHQRPARGLRNPARSVAKHPKLSKAAARAPHHLGTLGTGNHFIELCLDESDRVWVMRWRSHGWLAAPNS